ncbi:hexaprenyldihydroxybenzoate methyltransferase mitochondrial precursor [Lojkania enalia]|uniref:Ubiquinone biosynthesis O-methyltransferase, mitochondrial n=1 Tax=Lojkania enalia TaxID=147567 RepID=A0A9P4K4K0_9PLEO|nr:hexaprenyldihydroxybenzoate methyltransferase mitochondrial precursor [Didymosphaeria enalia]
MASRSSSRAVHAFNRAFEQTSQRPLSKRQETASITALTIRCSSTASQSSAHSQSSVDPSEVSHFNNLAESWWDPHGPSRLLHLMNPLRHTFISRCLSTPFRSPLPQKLQYLDVGCGGGIFAESAARLPSTKSVTAIDPTPEVLKIAEAHRKRDPTLLQPGRLTYLNKSIEELSIPGAEKAKYDVVSLFEVLEHVSTPSSFLEQLMQHVKPGGWLVLSTIARTWTSWMVTNVMAEDVFGIVPKGTHEWSKYVNEEELREWFVKKGWGSDGGMKVMGVVYVPGMGWKEVPGGEGWGNYFFGVRKSA